MSMLDAFFAKRFNAPKCKTLLKLTIPRIKLLRNRREIQIKQMRRDIAKLLETGQEATARIRVEHIIREENMLAAQEIIELFCELIAVRLPIIETQKECPLDLKEAISSVCFAAPRCADLQELQQVQMLFASKYGREFVSAATELMPDCGVNRQIIELLSIRAPPAETKLKLLKEIAEEHEVDWDPAASETELFKPHEDLLNGPTQFVSASELPLPKEKHDESFHSTPVEAADEQYDSDSGLDSLDLPEVPKVSLRPSPNSSSAPEMAPPHCPTSPDSGLDHEITRSSGASENILHEGNLDPEIFVPESEVKRRKEIQFLPFTFPSSFSSESFSVKHSEPTDSLKRTKSEVKSDPNMDLQDLLAASKAAAAKASAAKAAAESAERSESFSVKHSEPTPSLSRTKSEVKSDSNMDLQDLLAAAKAAAESAERSESFSVKHSEPTPSLSRTKNEVKSDSNMDLQDILAAAKAAAESAERSAAAARSAASLAEVKIAELIKKRTDRASENSEHGSYTEVPDQSAPAELPRFDHQQSFGEDIGASYSLDHSLPDHGSIWKSEPHDIPSYDTPKVGFESPRHSNDHESSHHQPQRLTSLEEDPYFSYPNLFTSQSLNPTSGIHPSADNSPSTHQDV